MCPILEDSLHWFRQHALLPHSRTSEALPPILGFCNNFRKFSIDANSNFTKL